MQSPQHRYRDQDHQEVGDHIEDRVPKIEVLGVHAAPLEQRVPDFRYRPTLEEEGKAKSDHVANGNEEDGEDGVEECLLGFETQVKDQDGNFGESDCWTIDDVRGGSPL